MNYADLKSRLAEYLHRTDLVAKTADFIATAEAYLFRELNVKEMQLTATGTTTLGYSALPVDFANVLKVQVENGGQKYTLDYMSDPINPIAVTAYPMHYSIEGTQIKIWGAADGQAYALFYTPNIAPLSDLNPTNWLITNAADLYLYASSLEAARYIRNAGEIDRLSGLVPALLESTKRYSERHGLPSIGSLRIRPRRG